MKLLLLLALATCVVVVTVANKPGAELVLSLGGANYAVNVALDFVTKLLTGLRIPGLSGKQGDLTYALDWAQINSFRRPAAKVAFSPDFGIRWLGSNAGLQVTGHARYNYKLWIVNVGKSMGSENGDDMGFTANIDGVNFVVDTKFTHSGDIILPHVGKCGVSISSLGLKFNGGKWYLQWIYDLLKGFIENIIKGQVESQVCNAVADQVKTNLANLLRNLNLKAYLQNDIFIDLGFTGVPQFTQSYMATPHKASIYWKTPEDSTPIEYRPLQGTRATSRMAKLLFSEYVGNALAYQADKHKLMNWDLPIPDEWLKFLANIELPITCAPADIAVSMGVNGRPNAIVKKDGIEISGSLRLTPKCKTAVMFSIDITITVGGNIALVDKVIKPNIKVEKFDFTFPVPIPGLKEAEAKGFVLMAINILLSTINRDSGIDLSNILDNVVPNVKFENGVLSTDTATAMVELDILYKPPYY